MARLQATARSAGTKEAIQTMQIIKHNKWLIAATIVCIILAFYLYRIESARRGHSSPGGELGIPFFPILLCSLKNTHNDFRQEVSR